MANFSIAALQAEIGNDPLGGSGTGTETPMGYAALKGNDQAIADLLNSLSGPGAAAVNVDFLSPDDFVSRFLRFLPAACRLPAAGTGNNPPLFYEIALNLLAGMAQVRYKTLKAFLDQAAADGIITANQENNLLTRTGSRAEVLWGAGTVITIDQVGRTHG